MKPLFFLLLAPLALVAAGAATPGIIGSWDCLATDTRGVDTRWGLTVKQDGEKFAATLRAPDGSVIDLLKPKLEDDHFSFTFPINETESVEVLLTLKGDRLEGRWAGTNIGAGLFKAVRAGTPEVTGLWTGQWEVDPDGNRDAPHYMALKQDGDAVTGTAGPNTGQQAAIRNGKLAGDKLTFDLGIPYGPTLSFAFTVSGDAMRGEAVLSMNGAERRFKLAAKRTR